MFADPEERTEVGQAIAGLNGRPYPMQERRKVAFDSPFSISRRSATTSIAATAASVLFCIDGVLPAVAAGDDLDAATATTTNVVTETKTSSADDKFDTSVDDSPVAKEKTNVYTVQDFSVALPVNWKVITKYDEKMTKPPSTPTLFSAIDFNSGAVISIVKEEACSVSEYARSSFEKSKKNPTKQCDFALRNTSEEGTIQVLFSPETYEKDASKLLVRHDDRDNAVLRGVSRIEESTLTAKGGRRRRHSIPPSQQSLSLTSDMVSTTDSYSSSLLELRATTTIPTSGTYQDGMGIEQPNTIDRKVRAKAVAITTRVMQTTAERAPPPPPPATDSKLLATEKNDTTERHGAANGKPIENKKETTALSKEEAAIKNTDLAAGTTADPSHTVMAEATTASASTKDVSKTESGPGVHIAEISEPRLGSTSSSNEQITSSETAPVSTEIASTTSRQPQMRDAESVDAQEHSVVASATKTVEKDFGDDINKISDAPIKLEDPKSTMQATSPSTKVGISTDSTLQANSTPDQPITAMMAMAATIVDEPVLPTVDVRPPIDTVVKSQSENPTLSVPKTVETAIERAQQRAIETVIEEAKERAIEQAIITVKETAKETAKEVAMELLARKIDVPAEATLTVESKHATTKASIVDSDAGAEKAATPLNSVNNAKNAKDTSIDASAESASSSSDASLLAIAPHTNPASSATVEPLAGGTTATTKSISVLSIWLSAPQDEWQKPVMGTKLNQIWESIEYANNIVEGTESLAMLPLGDDESSSINTQLLLMNNKSLR